MQRGITLSTVENINVAHIRECQGGLRPVKKDSEGYQGIVQSIRNMGFIGSITVRTRKDPVSGTSFYEIVDGHHRFSAAKDCGLEEIPCNIQGEMDETEMLEAQLMANVHKVETKPVEYSRQLLRILSNNEELTAVELANRLGRSPEWINQRLQLQKITDPDIQALIDDGKIKLSNAYALSKLDPEDQQAFFERAMTMDSGSFVPEVQERLKEVRAERRKGEGNKPDVGFQATPTLRKLAEIRELHTTGSFGDIITATDPVDAATQMLNWVLRLDPPTVAQREQEYNDRVAAREKAAAERKAERERQKQEKAEQDARDLQRI